MQPTSSMRYALVDLAWWPRFALVLTLAVLLAVVPTRPFLTLLDLLVIAVLIVGARERWF